jgi:tetratricopeptide (TPR) repeat protein
MTKHLIAAFFTIIIVFCFNPLFAKIQKDTSISHVLVVFGKALERQLAEVDSGFTTGVNYINHDNAQQGVQIISRSIKKAYDEKKLNSNFSYRYFEFLNLISIIEQNEYNNKEKPLVNVFLRSVFTKQYFPDENFKSYFNNSLNTKFTKRLKLFIEICTDAPDVDEQLNSFLKDNTFDFSANLLNVERLMKKNAIQAAIASLTKCIEISPMYAYLYETRGRCYILINEHEKALLDFNKAIVMIPNYYEAIYGRALQLQRFNRHREAIPNLRKIYSEAPTYGLTSFLLARSYEELKVVDSALFFINAFIKINPNKALGYHLKGGIYFNIEDYLTSVGFYSKAIALKPEEPSFYESRGNAYYFSDSTVLALKDFEKVIELGKSSDYAYRLIGECYSKLNNYEKAIRYYKMSVELEPKNELTWESLNLAYGHLKRYPEAIEAGLKSVAIDSTYSSAFANLGWTYYQSGDYQLSIGYSYRALRLNKGSATAMFNIALATLKSGQVEQAKKLYSKFINDCKQNGYKINNGAVTDLKDLIDQSIMVSDSKFIIRNIFGKE